MLIAEKRKRFNAQRSPENHGAAGELKNATASGMDARESLAKGNRRDGHLCDYVCADQWATAQDSAFEPASCCFARGGIDGFDRRNDAGARVSRSQLRHVGPVARDDADLGISLSGTLLRMGSRRRPQVLTDAATIVAFSDPNVGSLIRAARQRYDLFDADAVGGCSHPPR